MCVCVCGTAKHVSVDCTIYIYIFSQLRLANVLQLIQESPFLTMDILESCFPYCLVRNAYHHVYKVSFFSFSKPNFKKH